MMGRLTALALAAGIIAGGLAGWLLWPQAAPAEPPERSSAELMDALMWNREPVGGPFALIDHTGAPRTDADFRGKTLLIYFGFTFCSDICPIDLQSMAAAVDQLGAGRRSGAAVVRHRRSRNGYAGAIAQLCLALSPAADRPDR